LMRRYCCITACARRTPGWRRHGRNHHRASSIPAHVAVHSEPRPYSRCHGARALQEEGHDQPGRAGGHALLPRGCACHGRVLHGWWPRQRAHGHARQLELVRAGVCHLLHEAKVRTSGRPRGLARHRRGQRGGREQMAIRRPARHGADLAVAVSGVAGRWRHARQAGGLVSSPSTPRGSGGKSAATLPGDRAAAARPAVDRGPAADRRGRTD